MVARAASVVAFDLGGSGGRRKGKARPFRKVTARDVERKVLKQAGVWEQSRKLRTQPTDLERLLKASGYGPGIVSGLSRREQEQFEADLTFLGIVAGRTAGTLPERLVAKYLWGKGLPYEGMGYDARLYRGWAFQVPTLGGRGGSGSGPVLDVAIAGRVSASGKTVGVRVNGAYWHSRPGAPAHDARQKVELERAGFEVVDLWDYEVKVPGLLDARMRAVLR